MSADGRSMLQRIYLDANAGLPLGTEARAGMLAALGAANPSSVHAEGQRARAFVEGARAQVAGAVSAKAENVIFTSGATEAAALALAPHIQRGRETTRIGRLYIGATEHACVLSGGRISPDAITMLRVHPDGTVNLEALEAALAAHDHASGVPYVALMLANNETGVLHPVAKASAMVHAHGGYVFCDAVQALGRIPVEIRALGVDFLSLSSHKVAGPQGVGALVLADDRVWPAPFLTGGGQERRRRAGTENVAGIVGFGIAAELANHHLHNAGGIAMLRRQLEEVTAEISPEAVIFGSGTERLPNTVLFAVSGLDAETAVIAFDLEGIAVSAGSACSSGKVAASHVIAAMGDMDLGRCGIRLSLTPDAEDTVVDAFAAAWRGIYGRLRRSRAA